MHSAKTQISLGIHPVWSESTLCTKWVAKDSSFLRADSEDSDQTGRMPKLIWVFAGHTVTLLVLSCRGSFLILVLSNSWAASWQNQQNGMCAQRRLRSAWASAQSDQSLRCLRSLATLERTAKTLIRLGGCPGWFESSLGAQPFCWFYHEAAHLDCCSKVEFWRGFCYHFCFTDRCNKHKGQDLIEGTLGV